VAYELLSKLSLVEFSRPVTAFSAKLTLDENIDNAQLLHPGEYETRKYKLLAEKGESDPEVSHLYTEPKTRFADVLKRILRLERKRERSEEKLLLLEVALRVLLT